MAAALRPHSATGHPAMRPSELPRGGTLRIAFLTSVAVLVGALAISALMTISILMSGQVTWSDAGPMPPPMPQPSAEAGLDL